MPKDLIRSEDLEAFFTHPRIDVGGSRGSSNQVQEKIDAMVTALKKEQADEVKKKDLRIMAGVGHFFSQKNAAYDQLGEILTICFFFVSWQLFSG